MDTATAIATLQTLSENLDAQITQLTTEKQAVDIAVAQLQGTLNTPSADLAEAESTISELQGEVTTLQTTENTQPLTPASPSLSTP